MSLKLLLCLTPFIFLFSLPIWLLWMFNNPSAEDLQKGAIENQRLKRSAQEYKAWKSSPAGLAAAEQDKRDEAVLDRAAELEGERQAESDN